ncbi:hypothetical protein [Dyella psychrodurans]|uniref:Uncharacterized protein n=1 Tax=Dyella psychrodurans TaxID=1927960 RepID=A0A370XBV8_9GAMM|nr:hypothetical protein [Dyella psychrodurans]RDS85888.1 hypothetical protein DWU99_01020 [Dyella psychrodurans]
MSTPMSQDFLNDQWAKVWAHQQTPWDPQATTGFDNRDQLSVHDRPNDPTAPRRVFERTATPAGLTHWTEVPAVVLMTLKRPTATI